jgi:glycosyltransferase involved in cell wall biosynthesis
MSLPDVDVSLPDVDVVIPTKDRPELVDRAVQSVLAQDYAGSIRVLVVADGSPPNLRADDNANRSVQVLRNDRAPSAAAARNVGILAAEAPLVAFCDDDDTWKPGKLTAQVAALRSIPDAIGCGTGFVRVVFCGIGPE